MKKIVCSGFGTIYYATILKDGLMSSNGRVDVTDDALFAVMQHLMSKELFIEKGYMGYEYPNQKDSSKSITLMAYDENYTVIKKELVEELKEYKAMYESLNK